MLVRSDADPRNGWWIDKIKLDRAGRPLFLNYPFFDNAELGLQNWTYNAPWGRTTEISRDGTHSFTDSPGTDTFGNPITYPNNQPNGISLRFAYAIDFLNDTPGNLILTDRNPAGGNQGGAAVNPYMTFWWRRAIASGDSLLLEWRRVGDPDNTWQRLWVYNYGMQTGSGTNGRTGRQLAWERVEVDLTPMTRTFNDATSVTEDDVLIRFRLTTDGTNADDGVWIDQIEIKERPTPREYRLWSGSRTVAGAPLTGSGPQYYDDVDSPEWYLEWINQGGWVPIEWEQQNGLRGFHESTDAQVRAPNAPTVSLSGTQYVITAVPLTLDPAPEVVARTRTPDDTFHILEMARIFDLRGTQASELPTLYFWNRYHSGRGDRLMVQVSTEMTETGAALTTAMNSRCGSGLEQCYEQVRGWNRWETIWSVGELRRTWTWQREQVSLNAYVGRRVRIRFVNDALDNSDNRDGWYIDNVSVSPRRDAVITRLTEAAFFDGARNMANWVAEGGWGLDAEFYRGTGGGPANLGIWTEYMWNCNNCASLAGGNFPRGVDRFLDDRRNGPLGGDTPGPDSFQTRTVGTINYDPGSRAPIPGIFNRTDRWTARWVLLTPVIGTGGVSQGDYTLITISDDGVRLKYEEVNSAGTAVIDADPRTPAADPVPPPGSSGDALEWNVINNWSEHGRTSDIGVVSLQNGKRYRITLEYFESTGDSTAILTVGGNAFSFTDTPKLIAGPTVLDVPSVPNSNSSLILDGTIDLAGTTNPVLQYHTYYEIDGQARVEVSIDGGFTWRNDGFTDSIVVGGVPVDTNFQSGNFGGIHMPPTDWQRRRHNLTRYAGSRIMIRFRFDRIDRGGDDGTQNVSIDNTSNPYAGGYNANTRWVGWWVVDIRLAE
jgi:hypothetical protein